MNQAFLTFCYGDNDYFHFARRILKKFEHAGYDLFVYTDKPHLFSNVNTITYDIQPQSYHHKINGIYSLVKLGYEKILYMDADIIINDDQFVKEVSRMSFPKGFNYTRSGNPLRMDSFLENRPYYKLLLEESGYDYKGIESIFEDVFYFNFTGYGNDYIEEFFNTYYDLAEIKHKADITENHYRYGDQEGYSIALSLKYNGIHSELNTEFRKLIRHLMAVNFTYDGVMNTIMSEVDFIFPYRKDSNEREKNLTICLDYYKRYFKMSNFIISEQGSFPTFESNEDEYIFYKKELPHNQSKCINIGVRVSKKKIVCVIDVDIILLDFHNIYLAVKDIFKNSFDYILPYTECVDLPNFEVRRPWGKECIGGIFIIDRKKFIDMGMNDESFEGWGREDDARHEKLINLGFRFKRFNGHIIHMEHPLQKDINITSEINKKILNTYKDDNSSPHKTQKRTLI